MSKVVCMCCHDKTAQTEAYITEIYLLSSAGWKFKIKVLSGLISPEASLLGLQKGRRGSHGKQPRPWKRYQSHWVLWHSRQEVGTGMYREAMWDASECTCPSGGVLECSLSSPVLRYPLCGSDITCSDRQDKAHYRNHIAHTFFFKKVIYFVLAVLGLWLHASFL